jgi:plastocyanin/uncharacterized protein YneR
MPVIYLSKRVVMKSAPLIILFLFFYSTEINAQSPGLIVRPAGGNGITALNPDGNGFSSATTSGFTTDDINQSEIAFKVVPAAIMEPTGDLSTGPSGGYSDIVTRVDGSGFYTFKDATNIYFRLRIGGIISGSKGYSVLIDTDGKFGASGVNADPNYVAPSGNNVGNPGFEYEVSLQTNFQVAVYNVNGSATPGTPVTYPLSSNTQISTALSTDGNNPDYFYDWYVPLSAIGNPSSIRLAITTVVSPSSAFQGSISDIYGINDATSASIASSWQTVVNAQPSITLSGFTGVSATCTVAPVVTTPVIAGAAVTVSGTWTKLDASKPSTATITLYKNGIAVGSSAVNSGATWNIAAGTIATGDVLYAKAQAAGESLCLESNVITSTACTTAPATPVLTCASIKGISGTMPSTASGNTVAVYLVPSSSASPMSNLISNGVNLTYPTTTSFAFYTAGCSGGTNNVVDGVYMIITQNGNCISGPAFACVANGNGTIAALVTNTIALPTPIYPGTIALSGSGTTSGNILRLFINGRYVSTITASASTFSFPSVTLSAGDQIKIYSQTGTACLTQSATFTVSCYNEPPTITTNTTGNLLTGASVITGKSQHPGATVQLYKGIAPSGVATGSGAIVLSTGLWSVTVPALVANEQYYAIENYNGCASAATAGVTVLSPTTCPDISGTYNDAATSISGTMPASFTGTIRLYLDGALIGSQAVTSALNWSIAVPSGTLYYNAVLTATAQATGNAESSGCASKIISCTSPLQPVINPLTTTIAVGQTVNFSVSNTTVNSWYALTDNSGVSYAPSAYRTNTSNFSLNSATFTAAGTYNLKLSADLLTGCPAASTNTTIQVNSLLPLHLVGFSASYAAGKFLFSWQTQDEFNVSHFDVEESADGIFFTTLVNQPAKNNSGIINNYKAEKKGQLIRPTHFRLKMTDLDGSVQYSEISTLKPDVNGSMFSISPNPFKHELRLKYSAAKNSGVQVSIFAANGVLAFTEHYTVSAGTNSLKIDNLRLLPNGVYYIVISDDKNRQVYYREMIKAD